MSDIVMNDVVYKDVNSITVNKATGGSAKYTEGERPSGTIEITENGTHNVTDYENANVNVPVPDLSQTTATADDVLEGKEFFNASGEKVAGTYKDMLQEMINGRSDYKYMFGYSSGSALDNVKGIVFPKTATAMYMLQYASGSNSTIDIRTWNLQSIEDVKGLFYYSSAKTIYLCDTTNFKDFSYMFSYASIERIKGELNLINATNVSSMFNKPASVLREVHFKNIRLSLIIGSGTSSNQQLNVTYLINAISELWINTEETTKTLTIGTTNLGKLSNIYVKLIDITDEMRAEDEYIDNKAPFVQCESTDEGAMLITEYVTTVKNWKLA